jgi:hypothetical protein
MSREELFKNRSLPQLYALVKDKTINTKSKIKLTPLLDDMNLVMASVKGFFSSLNLALLNKNIK